MIITLYLAPNMKTGIKVLKKAVTRQKSPYVTNCSDLYPPDLKNNLIDWSNTRYNEDYCKSMCIVTYVHQKCHCYDPTLMEANFLSNVQPKDLKFCSIVVNTTDRNCSLEAKQNYTSGSGKSECTCRPSCNEEEFEVPKE